MEVVTSSFSPWVVRTLRKQPLRGRLTCRRSAGWTSVRHRAGPGRHQCPRADGPESPPGLPALTPRSAAARCLLPLRDALPIKRHFQRLWLIFHSLSPTNSPLSSYSIIHKSSFCRLPSPGNGLPRTSWPDALDGGKGKQLMAGEM